MSLRFGEILTFCRCAALKNMFCWFLGMKKAALCLAAVPTLRKCCGVAVFSCSGVVRPLVGARTKYPVFTFLMMITSFKALCPYE